MTRVYTFKYMRTQPDRVSELPEKAGWDWEVDGLKRTKLKGSVGEGQLSSNLRIILDHRARTLLLTSDGPISAKDAGSDLLNQMVEMTLNDGILTITGANDDEFKAFVEDSDLVFGLLHKLKQEGFEA